MNNLEFIESKQTEEQSLKVVLFNTAHKKKDFRFCNNFIYL